MTVVADASPLIFLGKIRRLALIHRVLGHDIVVPQQIREEVLARPLDSAESDELHRFLAAVRMERVDSPRDFAAGMSRADNAAMTLAVRLKADLLLTDDRTVRRLATARSAYCCWRCGGNWCTGTRCAGWSTTSCALMASASASSCNAAVIREIERLSGTASTTIGTRTIDLLHVAAALSQGVTGLVSLHHRQCAAARLAGLEVVEPGA